MSVEGSEGTFHYSRDERLKLAGPRSTDTRPWHKRNKGHLILIADIVLILGFIIVYNLFLRPDLGTEEFGDHRFELRALEFDGETLASIKITALKNLVPGSSGIVRFEFSAVEDFSEAEDIQEVLPDAQGQDITLRLRLPLAGTVYVRGDILSEGEEGEWDFSMFMAVEPE